MIAAATGVGKEGIKRAESLIEAGVDIMPLMGGENFEKKIPSSCEHLFGRELLRAGGLAATGRFELSAQLPSYSEIWLFGGLNNVSAGDLPATES